MVAGRNSALTAVGRLRSIGQQSAAYLPFSLSRSRTTAFPFGECVLRAHKRHSGFAVVMVRNWYLDSTGRCTSRNSFERGQDEIAE